MLSTYRLPPIVTSIWRTASEDGASASTGWYDVPIFTHGRRSETKPNSDTS